MALLRAVRQGRVPPLQPEIGPRHRPGRPAPSAAFWGALYLRPGWLEVSVGDGGPPPPAGGVDQTDRETSIHLVMRSNCLKQYRRLSGVLCECEHYSEVVAARGCPRRPQISLELMSLQCRGVGVGFEMAERLV